MERTLTTEEAAERLGVTTGRVRAMIGAGRLPAQKFGHIHMIQESDLKLVEDRKTGRPPKPKPEAPAPSATTKATKKRDGK